MMVWYDQCENEQVQAKDDPRDEDEDVNEDKYTGFR